MENNDNVIVNEENTAETEIENDNQSEIEDIDINTFKVDTESDDLLISERTQRIIKERRKRKKKRYKIRMNFLYKIGFILFVIAIGLLITAMVICLVEGATDHDSFLAILFSMISAFFAFLGIIFTCVSKEKTFKKRRVKKNKINYNKAMD